MTVRTSIWLAASLFILISAGAAIVHARGLVPWLWLVASVGLLGGVVALALEALVADPLEGMAGGAARRGDPLKAVPRPIGWLVPVELRKLWRVQRALEEQASRHVLAAGGLDARVAQAEREARLLRGAAQLLAAEAGDVEHLASWLDEVAQLLEVDDVWLVPLRRQAPWPIVGRTGAPAWADSVRPRSAAWGELLSGSRARLFCVAPGVLPADHPLVSAPLAILPLFHRGRAQGFFLIRLDAYEPTWPMRYVTVVESLAPMLAAALYPYRWADGRRIVVDGAAREDGVPAEA